MTTTQTNSPAAEPTIPITGDWDDLSIDPLAVALGSEAIIELNAGSKVDFYPLDSAMLAVGDSSYSDNDRDSRARMVGLASGETQLLAIRESDHSAKLIPVVVYEPTPEGERRNILPGADLTVDLTNSPAAEGIANLADGSIETKWLVFSNRAVIEADVGYPASVQSFELTSANDDPVRDPSDFALYGSKDGSNWTLLKEVSGERFEKRREKHEYTLETQDNYRYFKLSITANCGGSELQLSEFALFEVGQKVPKADSIPEKTPVDSKVRSITLSADSVYAFYGEDRKLTATTEGDKSKVHFISTTDSVELTAPVYDAANGQTSVTLRTVGTSEGRLIAYSEDGPCIVSCPLSTIGEGAYINATPDFTIDGAVNGTAVGIGKLIDDRRKTEETIEASALEVIFTSQKGGAVVNRYAIVSGQALDTAPSAWEFYGSNDQSGWKLLDRRQNERFEGQNLRRLFEFDNHEVYRFYKLVLKAEKAPMTLSELQLFTVGSYPSWALGPFEKVDDSNPILVPNDIDYFLDPISNTNVYWSNEALYNPAAVVKDDVICVLYRSQDHPLVSRVGLALSLDGIHFDHLPEPVVYPENDEFYDFEIGGGDEDPRVVRDADGTYYMYYSSYDRSRGICRLFVATSTDLEHWTKQGNAIGDAYDGKYKNMWAKSASVICDMVGDQFIARRFEDGHYYMYFGEGTLYCAWSDDLIHWTPLETESGNLLAVLTPRPGAYDSRLVECGPPAIYTEYGILLIYNGANADPEGSGDSMIIYNAYSPGQVVFDSRDITKVTKITENCFMYPEKDYELEGLVNNVCFVEGLVYYKGSWYLYYGTADSRLAVAVWKAPVRSDDELNAAIAEAEHKTNLSEEAEHALKVAKEASVAAIYSQAQVDELARRLTDALNETK